MDPTATPQRPRPPVAAPYDPSCAAAGRAGVAPPAAVQLLHSPDRHSAGSVEPASLAALPLRLVLGRRRPSWSGILLQWIGHLAEGNDLGEWAAIKRVCSACPMSALRATASRRSYAGL